jgi:hypothetical protein
MEAETTLQTRRHNAADPGHDAQPVRASLTQYSHSGSDTTASTPRSHKLCLLVRIGVRVDGRKELIAPADGYRESAESRADLLRDCKRRGMRAPVLANGDGALGFWSAVREVFPETRKQRCWFHKDKDHARAAAKAFDSAYGTNSWPAAIGVPAIDGFDVVQLSAATRITVTGP